LTVYTYTYNCTNIDTYTDINLSSTPSLSFFEFTTNFYKKNNEQKQKKSGIEIGTELRLQ